jgi:SAM-dependent methyltransferase
MRIDDICLQYERIAEWFIAMRRTGPPLMERTYLEAVLGELPAEAEVLDLGCGGGEPLAGFFIRAGHPVAGVDGSARMIELCRERFPDMTWIQADMRSLSLGRTFGAVIAWDSFFHLSHEDQRAMFPIFDAHTAPGGLLLFTSGPDYGQATGVMAGVAFEHYSLSPEEYEELLAQRGFEVVVHRVEDQDCGGHTVWLARKRAEDRTS